MEAGVDSGAGLIVTPSKRFLRSEEPALSEVEGIWASRASRRGCCDALTARLARFLFKLHHYQGVERQEPRVSHKKRGSQKIVIPTEGRNPLLVGTEQVQGRARLHARQGRDPMHVARTPPPANRPSKAERPQSCPVPAAPQICHLERSQASEAQPCAVERALHSLPYPSRIREFSPRIGGCGSARLHRVLRKNSAPPLILGGAALSALR